MKPDEAMDLLREAHREPIPEAHFASVRARVLSQIAAERGVSRRRIWPWPWPWPWPWAFAVVSAAALLLAFWPKQASRIERPLVHARGSVRSYDREGVVVGSPRVTAGDTQPSPPALPIPRTHRKPPVTGVIGPPNPTPLVVKMLTDDPNVVIYWISAGTGE